MGGASNTKAGPAVNPDRVGEGLLAAVVAAPDDDAPRLVYADHLLERGDRRGEFIVAQCTCARLEREGRRGTAEYWSALRLARELFAAHEKAWVAPLVLRRNCTFARGFVEFVDWPFAEVRKRWSRLAIEPFRRLRITLRDDAPTVGELAWLLRQPGARQLESLWIAAHEGHLQLDPAVLAASLEATSEADEAPAWAPNQLPDDRVHQAVQVLTLARSTAGVIDRLQLSSFPRLRTLRFTAWDDDALPVLRETHEVTTLDVTVANAELGPRLLVAIPGTKLESFTWRIEGEHDREAAAVQVASASFLPRLASFDATTDLDPYVARLLADRAVALERLILSRHDASEDGLATFVGSALPARLRELGMHPERVWRDAAVLARADFRRLEKIGLTRFAFHETAATFGGPALVDLELRMCSVFARGARGLAASPNLACVYQPTFEHCSTDDAAKALLRERWPHATIQPA